MAIMYLLQSLSRRRNIQTVTYMTQCMCDSVCYTMPVLQQRKVKGNVKQNGSNTNGLFRLLGLLRPPVWPVRRHTPLLALLVRYGEFGAPLLNGFHLLEAEHCQAYSTN